MDTLIIAAAGSSTRMNTGTPKIFIELGGVPVLIRSISPAREIESITKIVVAVREADVEACRTLLDKWGCTGALVVPGGATRSESILNALRAADPSGGFVIVHDGARPLASPALWRSVMAAAREHGAAIPALPVTDTVKEVRDGFVSATVPRDALFTVQTPQAFALEIFKDAYLAPGRDISSATDDASAVEAVGHKVSVVPGEKQNIKITYPEDLRAATHTLQPDK